MTRARVVANNRGLWLDENRVLSWNSIDVLEQGDPDGAIGVTFVCVCPECDGVQQKCGCEWGEAIVEMALQPSELGDLRAWCGRAVMYEDLAGLATPLLDAIRSYESTQQRARSAA